jgi:PAS domain S-box-containing protein
VLGVLGDAAERATQVRDRGMMQYRGIRVISDDFQSASGPSRRADIYAGRQADRAPQGVRRRAPGGDEPAHDDGRIPAVRNADRRPSGRASEAEGRASDATTIRSRAIERERDLADFLPEAYLVTDADGIVYSANQAASQLFGKRDAALRGAPIAELLVPADRARFRARFRRLLAGRASATRAAWTVRLQASNGAETEARASVRVVRDDSEGVSFVRWIIEPVGPAEPEAADDDAGSHVLTRYASRNARIAADAASFLSRSFDLDATLSAMARVALPALGDHAWVDIIEYEGDIVRLHVARREVKDAWQREALQAAPATQDITNSVISVLESGKPIIDRALTDEGLRRLAVNEEQTRALVALGARSVIIVPMVARNKVLGSLTFIASRPHHPHRAEDLALAHDLAQRAALAADNARLFAMAQDASRAKDEFMASMSHELRTPLTAIIGYTELLGDEIVGPLNATQREQLARIRASGNLLLALVDQILDLARVDSGEHAPRVAEVSAAAIVDQAVMLIGTPLRQKNLALTVKAPPPDVVLVTDPLWLRQILVNLLGNAVKFTERGEVGISAAREGDTVAFDVWDTGIGIPAKFLDRIYDPFWQAEQRMTRRYGGAGVGLAVAYRLTTLLNGEIEVTSTVGVGSRFTVRLPVRAAS